MENLFEGDEYTGALDLILTKGNLAFNKYLNPSDIEKLYYNDPETYNKVISWFTLRNFDHFVNLILGDFIYINPEHGGKLSSGNSY
jgi:subtilase family serine protease